MRLRHRRNDLAVRGGGLEQPGALWQQRRRGNGGLLDRRLRIGHFVWKDLLDEGLVARHLATASQGEDDRVPFESMPFDGERSTRLEEHNLGAGWHSRAQDGKRHRQKK